VVRWFPWAKTGFRLLWQHIVAPANVELFMRVYIATLRLDGGLPDFKNHLGKRIHLPPDKRQWPEPNIILKANAYRRIVA
jgi:hypothetical protein